MFWVAFIRKFPFPVRFDGKLLVAVSHGSLLVAVHVPLEVTFIMLKFALAVGFQAFADKERFAVAPACVMRIVRNVVPVRMVIVPFLRAVPVFSRMRILNPSLPLPLALSCISQE